MNNNRLLLWLPYYPTLLQSEWDLYDIQNTFFKCISWQVEETLDATSCPYHYVCDKTYPPNFPLSVDILVLLFTSVSYLVTLFIVIMDMSSTRRVGGGDSREIMMRRSPNRYLLPCGPISLPIIILAFAKGSQINTIFPIHIMGPSILQLVLISALSFDYGSDKDLKYVIFAASTVSGILHASLYLDSVMLPYYTGFDALVSSTFSGECETCVCRKEALVVGGKFVKYRGWSLTTFLVVGVLCLRILCRIMCGVGSESENGKLILLKNLMERLCWVSIAIDCVYLAAKSPPERGVLRIAAFGGILLLICLQVLKEACTHIYALANVSENMKWVSTALQTK